MVEEVSCLLDVQALLEQASSSAFEGLEGVNDSQNTKTSKKKDELLPAWLVIVHRYLIKGALMELQIEPPTLLDELLNMEPLQVDEPSGNESHHGDGKQRESYLWGQREDPLTEALVEKLWALQGAVCVTVEDVFVWQ